MDVLETFYTCSNNNKHNEKDNLLFACSTRPLLAKSESVRVQFIQCSASQKCLLSGSMSSIHNFQLIDALDLAR